MPSKTKSKSRPKSRVSRAKKIVSRNIRTIGASAGLLTLALIGAREVSRRRNLAKFRAGTLSGAVARVLKKHDG